MNSAYCLTCETETEVKQTSHLARCMMCGDSEGLVFEDEPKSETMTEKEGMLPFKDKDIATIEAMHDLLLDHGHKLSERALKESRELTHRMYKVLKWSYNPETPYKQKDNE